MQDVQGVGGAGRKLRLALHSLTKAQSCFKKFRPQVTVTGCCWVLGMLPVPPAGLHPVSPLLVGRLEQGQQSQNQMQVCPSLVLALPIEWAASRLRPSFTPSSRKYAEDPPGPLPRSSSLLGDPLPSSFHCTGLGKVTWAKAHSKVLHPGELRTVFTSGLFPPAIWGRFLSVWKVKFPLLPCHLGLIGT